MWVLFQCERGGETDRPEERRELEVREKREDGWKDGYINRQTNERTGREKEREKNLDKMEKKCTGIKSYQ